MIIYIYKLIKKIFILLIKKINNKLNKNITVSELNYTYLQCLIIALIVIKIF